MGEGGARTSVTSDGAVVIVTGPVDFPNACRMTELGLHVLNDTTTPKLVLDLAAVTSLDSYGIGALFVLRQAANTQRKELVLANPSAPVRKLLRVARVDDVFHLASVE